MAVPLVGTGGFFTRLGRLGKSLYLVNGHQSDLDTLFGSIAAQYASTALDIGGQLAQQRIATERQQSGIIGLFQSAASQTLLEMMQADSPAAARAVPDALAELIRQMKVSGDSVQVCTVSETIAALGTPTGTGAFVASTKRGDGLVNENIIAEVGRLICTSDSYSGGQTQGREQFRYVGDSSLGGSIFDYDWPNGTDANTNLTAVSADQNASSTGNLLTNGNFETWTGGTPTLNGNNWVTTGTAGTDWAQDAATPFRGSFDLQFISGTGVLSTFKQTFNSSLGTTAVLKPNTSYAVNTWLKRAGSVTGGVLTFELVDGSNTVINDQQGTANSFTQTLSALTTSYAAVNGVFRTPTVLPSTYSLRFRTSTALTGANVQMDDICMTPLVAAYSAGPGLAVFSGVTPFVMGDTWTVTGTNNRGGASRLATFQTLMDRFYGMRGLGLLLPSSGSPTIADSLITS